MAESPIDDLLLLVAHRPRRDVLEALVGRSTGVLLDECLDVDTESSAIYEEQKHHLDALERGGLVTYDESTRRVFQGSEFDRIVPLLRAISQMETDHAETDHAAEEPDSGRTD